MTTVITDLNKTLPVSKDAIASRPLMDLKGSTKLVLFAMDAGQEISAHSAPFPAQVLVLDGSIEVMVDGVWSTLNPGERKDLPKGLPHGVRGLEPSHWLLTMLRGEYVYRLETEGWRYEGSDFSSTSSLQSPDSRLN